ncbi:MAG: hypothetical protein PHU46_12180 [Rhodocyclaceae bacterium]|nr:hypothetical protein [Rhodocyclaceae bacterium]
MIPEIIARLKTVPNLLLVDGAAGFAAAADPATGSKPRAAPAAFVLRLAESGEKSQTYMRVEQRVSAVIGIVYALRNVADAKGAAAGADLEALRQAGRAALLGWHPEGADPFEFDAGALLAFKDGYLWWQDSYRTRYDILQS